VLDSTLARRPSSSTMAPSSLLYAVVSSPLAPPDSLVPPAPPWSSATPASPRPFGSTPLRHPPDPPRQPGSLSPPRAPPPPSSYMAPPSVRSTVGHHHGCGLGPARLLLLQSHLSSSWLLPPSGPLWSFLSSPWLLPPSSPPWTL
ncbi:hypothetical protein M9458_038104, partial [Cirrhinus mrigala]